MALIHQAQLTPSKLDLLTAWVPARPWLDGADASTLDAVGAYRFDDPAGQVGIETHLVRTADGRLLQVPLTYRGAPLAGAEPIGTMEHSVLGTRWVYDGCLDPVYAQALAAAVLTGGSEALLEVVGSPRPTYREPTVRVKGSGRPGSPVPAIDGVDHASTATETAIRGGGLEMILRRVIDPGTSADGSTLVGTWAGQDSPALLASIA
ncbi:MAG: CG0192-related protein [Candidatus Limnocylindrales bacterium]